MQAERSLEVQQPGYCEEREPDPGNADADGESSKSSTPVMHDVVAGMPRPQAPGTSRTTGRTHAAEGVRQSAEGAQAAEDQREDAADQDRGSKHPTEPSMEGVLPAADPVGERESCRE